MNTTNNTECRSCGGEGHHGLDEDGCLYTCYACGGTGTMTPGAAAEWDEEHAPFVGPVRPRWWDAYAAEAVAEFDALAEEFAALDAMHTCGPDPRIAAFWQTATLDELMNDDVPF